MCDLACIFPDAVRHPFFTLVAAITLGLGAGALAWLIMELRAIHSLMRLDYSVDKADFMRRLEDDRTTTATTQTKTGGTD